MFIGAPFSASYLVVPRHLLNNVGEKKVGYGSLPKLDVFAQISEIESKSLHLLLLPPRGMSKGIYPCI